MAEAAASKVGSLGQKSQWLFIDRAFSEDLKTSAEFENFFAAEIAEGLLSQERAAVVNDLRNLIQMGFMLEFQEQLMQFLLIRENMEVSIEDEEFLAVVFPVVRGELHYSPAKQCSAEQVSVGPLTPTASVKRRRLEETGMCSVCMKVIILKITK